MDSQNVARCSPEIGLGKNRRTKKLWGKLHDFSIYSDVFFGLIFPGKLRFGTQSHGGVWFR